MKVQNQNIFEELNIRSTVNNYISTQSLKPDEVHKRRQFLPADDVRWSHKHYSHIVATAAHHGRIALYDVSRISSRVDLNHIYQHTNQVHTLDFDPHSGYMLLSGGQDKYCKIWDIREPRKPKGYAQYYARSSIRDARWSPTDAMEFALCTDDGTIQKWDVRHAQQPVLSIKAHEKPCVTLSWHPDGRHVVTGSFDRSLKIWDLKSDNRRQKPVLHLRCPAEILKVAWRPLSWSAEFAERGTWQTTQVATCYNKDDPRIHVWDLRRPLLPSRELNQYESRPKDLLWASKDVIWTVGDTGSFTQTEVPFAQKPEDSLPPCAVEWAPDGKFYAVTEDKVTGNRLLAIDPTAMFLDVPKDRLSGADDSTTSRSLTDDEGLEVALAEQTSQRQSKAPSTKSGKSQANTPPHHEDLSKILSLDRSIMAKKERFSNHQIGAVTQIEGSYLPTLTLEQLALFYTVPMTQKERIASPDEILPRLQRAFQRNSAVCQVVGQTEQATNWQLLEAVVIPELQSWADHNRRQRLAKEIKEQPPKEEPSKTESFNQSSPFAKLAVHEKDGKSPAARSEKIANNLFRGVIDSQRGSSDSGSHGGSNMTTPRQQPASNSAAIKKQAGNTWFTLDDAIEPIQPLPPSLAHSHSTANAASRALLEDVDDLRSSSTLSSPEKLHPSPEKTTRHRRSATESVTATMSSVNIRANPKSSNNERPQVPVASRTQEDRRAALRDYKVPTRQPFSLDAPVASPKYGREVRHDSGESFPMFSASAESSVRARSLGRLDDETPDSMPAMPLNSRQNSDQWVQSDSYYDSIGRSEKEWGPNRLNSNVGIQAMITTAEDSPSIPFNLDGISGPKSSLDPDTVQAKTEEIFGPNLRSKDTVPEEPQEQRLDEGHITTSTSTRQNEVDGEIEPLFPYTKQKIYHSNPLLYDDKNEIDQVLFTSANDVSKASKYHASDFRPIDINKYESAFPWALSAYPTICTAIQLDAHYGIGSCQFSAHLISHLYPFFFHQSTETARSETQTTLPTSMSGKLQQPKLRSRVIEGILASHIEHLCNLGLHLPAAHLRKHCVEEFGFSALDASTSRTTRSESVGDQLKSDSRMLKATCTKCKQFVAIKSPLCKNCKQVQGRCPICELPLSLCPDEENRKLDSYCQVCGHSAHLSCMSKWLSLSDTQGECPTPNCGCDCGPGLRRIQRIARQIAEREERDTIRSSISSVGGGLRKDPRRASVSPAVEKARNSLRKTSSSGLTEKDRGTQSGDEKIPSSGGTTGSAWSKKGTSASTGRGSVASAQLGRSNSGSVNTWFGGSSSGGTSLGRRVRLVEPEEE